jgi:hypothetical protein
MGFETDAFCYRAGPKPPIITGPDLSAFCRRVEAIGIIGPDYPWSIKLKYGQSIDQDDRSMYQEKVVAPGIFALEPPAWDVVVQLPPRKALALLDHPPASTRRRWWALFNKPSRPPYPIYRANLYLGVLKDEYCTTIQHELQQNYLSLGEISFSIGVKTICDANAGTVFEVGWMALHVSGPGYPFPWTYEETLQRIHDHPQLQALRELCREMWPAAKVPVDAELCDARRQMGKFWQGPVDAPHDWYWVIQGCV